MTHFIARLLVCCLALAAIDAPAQSSTNRTARPRRNFDCYRAVYSCLVPRPPPIRPHYIDCRPDGLVLLPGNTKLTLKELQQPGNVFEQLLDDLQSRRDTDFVFLLVRPGSAKFYRAARKLLGQRPLDIGYDLLDADVTLEFDRRLPTRLRCPSEYRLGERQPLFFECRGNEVFFLDMENLSRQEEAFLTFRNVELPTPADVQKRLKEANVENEYYQADPKYLVAAVLALKPKPGLHGDTIAGLRHPTGLFQTTLKRFPHCRYYAHFLVRDDSFKIARLAERLAREAGYETDWSLLDADELIKFGHG